MSLEQFIAQNRIEFDNESPSDSVRQGVFVHLELAIKPAAKGWSIWRNTRLARFAAAVTLLLVGVGMGYVFAPKATNSNLSAVVDVLPEYTEAAEFYQRDIAAKRAKLAQFVHQKAEVEPDLLQLEQVMEELKTELEHVPPSRRQDVVAAMIKNYQTRAAILQKVLLQLDEAQQPKSQKNETSNI
jgi:hypothetical protein